MTQKKVSNERIAKWLGLLRQELIENDGTIITTWINADRSYCYGRTDELDFTDPAWTGPLLEKLRANYMAKYPNPCPEGNNVLHGISNAIVPYMLGLNKYRYLNSIIIAALDKLDRESK